MRATFHSLCLGLFLSYLVGVHGGAVDVQGGVAGVQEAVAPHGCPIELTPFGMPGHAEHSAVARLETLNPPAGPSDLRSGCDALTPHQFGQSKAHSRASAPWGNRRAGQADREAGAILAVGGGGTPRQVVRDAVLRARAHRPGAVAVAVIPYASSREDAGQGSAEMWLEEGADSASVVRHRPDEARKTLANAGIIWMGGGDQGRLLDALEEMALVEAIRAAHQRGAIVGGTSAGAAVLGSVCIAGAPDPVAYERGAMPGRPGLGLVKDTIVDQHFRERRRESRLLTAVLDAGGLRGVGVSEKTAVWFEGDSMSVAGEGVAIVFDANASEAAAPAPPDSEAIAAEPHRWSATGIVTSILAPESSPAKAR
ncbi:MAG: cyanophycinase [Planctomycetota bacterium]